MDPYTGKLYRDEDLAGLEPDVRARLVEVRGKERDLERLSAAAAHYAGSNRAARRAAAKAERRR